MACSLVHNSTAHNVVPRTSVQDDELCCWSPYRHSLALIDSHIDLFSLIICFDSYYKISITTSIDYLAGRGEASEANPSSNFLLNKICFVVVVFFFCLVCLFVYMFPALRCFNTNRKRETLFNSQKKWPWIIFECYQKNEYFSNSTCRISGMLPP